MKDKWDNNIKYKTAHSNAKRNHNKVTHCVKRVIKTN